MIWNQCDKILITIKGTSKPTVLPINKETQKFTIVRKETKITCYIYCNFVNPSRK